MFCYFGAMRDFSSNETPHFPARLLSLFFVVKNRGKRIKTNQQTLEISGIFRFVFIIVYGHTFATNALAHGMDIKTLSTILGHVSSATTLNTYSHVTDEMRQKAAAKIDMGIAKAEPQPTEESTPRERTMTTFQARKRWSPKAG